MIAAAAAGGGRPFATDPATLTRLFGRDDLLPLWVAEPSVPLAPAVVSAVTERATAGWYGYETRPPELLAAFGAWTRRRHGWAVDGLHTSVSPSVGTSIGVLLELLTESGDGVVLQPPVFTDFKPLVRAGGRRPRRNPLVRGDDGYAMDLDGLDTVLAEPTTTALILCNPHNPVGRAWRADELAGLAATCAAHDVAVIADEIHADIVLPGNDFTPFATAAAGSGVRWAALHGPIKTFGLAGLCDTLLLTDDDELHARFERRSSQLHLTRNNVVALAAFEAAYRSGGAWLDGLLADVAANAATLAAGLPEPLRLLPVEGTYLGWLDLRGLGLDVPGLTRWLVDDAGLALSPGHWFGREGAGHARITLAVPAATIEAAVERLVAAVR